MKRLVFALFGVLLFAVPSFAANSLTLSDMRDHVRRIMRDTPVNTDDRRYSDDFLNDVINESHQQISGRVWNDEHEYTFALTAQTSYYFLPWDVTDIVAVRWVKTNNEKIDLDRTTRQKLMNDNPNWERFGGPPSEYFVQISSYQDNLEMWLIPAPDTNNTGSVQLRFRAQPLNMTADADRPFNGEYVFDPYHYTIVYLAVGRLKLLEGRTNEAQLYYGLAESSIENMKAKIGNVGDYNPSFRAAPGR